MKEFMRICGGSAHPALTDAVFKAINDLSDWRAVNIPTENKQFSDGETRVKIDGNVRGCHVYVLQPTCAPANDSFMELFIMLDALKRASAEHITAVIPYMGYARQDKKVKPREPITSRMCADILQLVGAGRVITIDVHSSQHQGFYNIPVDNLYGGPLLGDYFFERYYGNKFTVVSTIANKLCVVSPDASGAGRAEAMANHLSCDAAIIRKRRSEPGVVASMSVAGDVKGKECLIIDDMMDSCGTLVAAANVLFDEGATAVDVAVSHPVLSGPGAGRLKDSAIRHVACLDTIPINQEKLDTIKGKLKVLSCSKLLALAITRHYTGESISSLFDNWGK